jgi:glycosyltransferase involved in cell wall biosynthesis
MLQGFWSGVPIQSIGSNVNQWLPKKWSSKLKRADIPSKLCEHPLMFPLLYRATQWLPLVLEPRDIAHRIDYFFDAWVAKRIRVQRPRVVVAYENAARDTFLAAKAMGVRCILDAASFHHATSARLSPSEPTSLFPAINRRKDEEVELADLILTCSPLAAESYVAAGVPESKIQVLPLGAALPSKISIHQKHSEALHFVFAGGLRKLKAIDVICKAFSRLNQDGVPYRLTFVGGEAEEGWIKLIRNTPSCRYLPSIPQAELFNLLGSADCLLLPSRYDAFGMVVAEAMACGTPAIVSSNTGAKLMIEAVPGAGWVVDCSVEGLLQCLRARIRDRDGVFAARLHARTAAAQFTWQAYRQRAAVAFTKWLR